MLTFEKRSILYYISLLLGFSILSGCDGSGENSTQAGIQNKATDKELKWELPEELNEVSGIVYIDENKIACIQDEAAIIYIFNLKNKNIEKKIPFHDPGDFEGLAIVGNDAYALRSDGMLFLVENFLTNPVVKEFNLDFPAKQNMEGLAYNSFTNKLLVVGKGEDQAYSDRKGIYAFDLETKKRDRSPVAIIDLNDEHFSAIGKKNKKKTKKASKIFQPSDIAVHPETKDYYILDRTKKQLLILSPSSSIKNLIELDENLVNDPEGIDITPSGDIYISSEFNDFTSGNVVMFKAGRF